MLVAVVQHKMYQETQQEVLAVVEMEMALEQDKLELTVSVAEAAEDKEHLVVMVVLE
tara:strand:- start:139 stop:309 length:171 start_codon:yes stop_codon:yes gene_type:complete